MNYNKLKTPNVRNGHGNPTNIEGDVKNLARGNKTLVPAHNTKELFDNMSSVDIQGDTSRMGQTL